MIFYVTKLMKLKIELNEIILHVEFGRNTLKYVEYNLCNVFSMFHSAYMK